MRNMRFMISFAVIPRIVISNNLGHFPPEYIYFTLAIIHSKHSEGFENAAI